MLLALSYLRIQNIETMLEIDQKINYEVDSSLKTTHWLVVICLTAYTPVFASEGDEIYKRSCAVCHAAGVPGTPDAPKISSRDYWYRRLFAGREVLLYSVLNGKGAMPPKGGDASLSDSEAEVALDYMLAQIESANKPSPGKSNSNHPTIQK